MPELPEVERGRRLAERVVRGRTIERVRCAHDPIVFDGVTGARVRRALTGRRVEAVRRRGKQLWFELDHAPHPLFHFGMTGAFRTPGAGPLTLASSRTGGEGNAWPPRFAKIRLHLDDGGELAMTNARRLGRIRLRDRPEEEPPISRLGFDPLLDLPPAAEFARLVRRRSVTLKGLLLDQSFAAGVGNWIADEVLYQARLDPRRRADGLTEAEARRVRAQLRAVVARAVEVNAEKDRFPRTWLFHRRWGKDADARTARGERIEFAEIAGRTTAWVPAVQR
jgi:formamidopyrimidine-DNA glycosylase